MSDLQNYLDKRLKDSHFAEEWEHSEAEYEVMKLIADARSEKGWTQKQLAEACGLKQSNISRLETGASSPTLKTLEQLANGLGKKLKVTFL